MPILEEGQLFERYRIHKWLGSGVAGESYEAEDRILQRKVTLKLIHPWVTLPDSARRQFFREMQGISLLNHPYLATVLDYGETEGRIYVARRYVSSGSLLGTNGRLWFHPPLPVAGAFKYAHQLAQALQYIHQHGYLHGSFTFANVLVLRGPSAEHDADYAPFLMADIGLANFVRRFGHPRLETLPVSAAPEQLGKRVTPASDQFALAVLLYFWLAGRPPYLGTSSEVEYQKLSETITPLSILNPGVTLEQDNIILRALTVYPEDRYPSVLAFTEELLASLTSANQLYAPPLAPLPETPHTKSADVAQDKVPANTVEAEKQREATNHTQDTTASTFAEEMPTLTPPSQSKAEPYRSALEELLALPQTSSTNISSNEEANKAPGEESEERDENVQQEDFALFPALPETPPLGEIPVQAEFAFIPSEELTERQTSKQTGPLAMEADVDTLYGRANKPEIEMPLHLPDGVDSALADEHPPVLEEASSNIWPDDQSSIDEGETPTIPREQFASVSKESEEHATSLSFDEPAPSEEVSTSAVLHDQPLPISEEAIPTISREGFAIDEEGFVKFSLDEFSPFSEMISPIILPDEPLLSNEETAPIVPLKESTASANEDTAPPPSDEPALPGEASIVASSQAEAVQVDEENAHPLAKLADILEEDVRSLAEQTNILEENTHIPAEQADTLEKDARILAEQADLLEENRRSLTEPTDMQIESQPASEERTAPTVPLKELASASAESTPPLSSNEEPALSDAESTPVTPQAETAPEAEGPRILAEMARAQLAETIDSTPVPTPDAETVLQAQMSAPIQETHGTSGATYPPIDEAIIAPRLIISSPYTSSSYEFLLIDEETNIGRAGSSSLYLEQDNLTSRHHALLKRVGERILIFDKRSHNGVFLNGQKIDVGRGYELADGDHIGIGNYELIFRSAPADHVSQLI